MSKIVVVQQVPHEGLGTLEPTLKAAGCALSTLKAPAAKAWPSPSEFDGLIVMGGPQSVYEQKRFPYLRHELALIEAALKAKRPILGICLGSQLLAAALGSTVRPNHSKEIGWHPIMREPGADTDPLCEPFGQTETVFQWHGDTFDLPRGATQLFSAPVCEQQGFRYGANAWALQFHVEVDAAMIASWIAKNTAELARLKGIIDPAAIRRQIPEHITRLQQLSAHVAATFAASLGSGAAKIAKNPRGAHAKR
jgi:GMP synthase (glutamine-hydrolysing)